MVNLNFIYIEYANNNLIINIKIYYKFLKKKKLDLNIT